MSEPSTAAALEDLPCWDLTDLYPGPESDVLKQDLLGSEKGAKAFNERWAGKVGTLAGEDLGRAITEYEALEEITGRAMSYAQLLHAGDLSDPEIARFYQAVQERVTAISAELLFFTLEVNALDDEALEAMLEVPEAARYRPWLRDVRLSRPHQLSEEAERLFHEKRLTGRVAWNRLFDETMADLRFPVDGRELTSQEALHLLSDGDATVRRTAAESVGAVLGANIRIFALITNTLAKDKEIEDGWRRFAAPQSSRNLANRVEDAVVDALTASVVEAYPNLSHRYYALKARWLGVPALEYWDRNAPLPEADERVIPWNEATGIVLNAYDAFSPRLGEIGRRFFDNAWIDAGARAGKSPGAFAHPTVPSSHPYLLLNYQGRARDVMTLAHELGHGVHQVLAGPRGTLMAETPLTLAETASVFGEMLTFRTLLSSVDEPARRKALLASKVEDMLNTVIRQVAFYSFELRVHEARRAGELTADRLGEIWMEVQGESLGPSVRLGGDYRHFWAYIPHFVHAPFYVYAYAFGDCLVNSLYAVYERAHLGFAEKYLDMLRAGGTLRHRELLAPFGLDASDPAFWSRGLAVIGGLIDELEGLG